MKKIFLFLFLLAIVSTKTLVLSNSLSPPTEPLDAILKAQLPMLQVPLAETQQFDVCFFERDVPCLVWFENLPILPDVSVGQTANFQVLINHNSARSFSGKSDILLQAMSPNCRTVITSDFFQNVMVCDAIYFTEAISPKCRTVLTVLRS